MSDIRDEFSTLRKSIESARAEGPVYYLPNWGNWGDALIRQGTLEFFRELQLDYLELPVSGGVRWLRPRFRAGTLIYGGGGAWCNLWSHAAEIINHRMRHFNKIIVLPSTFEKTFHIPSVAFFRRDRFESGDNMPESIFCHDMAFYLGRRSSPNGKGGGNFFRTDSESAGRIVIPEDNCDLSKLGDHLSDADDFFERLSGFEVIRTDRLHVGIAACLLGKELHLYPGAYFKNRAIFKSSMLGHFENVHFEEIEPISPKGLK